MTKLGISISRSVYALAEAGRLDADYIVYYSQIGPERLHEIVKYKPVMLHDLPEPFWLNYENPFLDSVMIPAREMLDTAKSPWLSTGIGASAEPQAHRDGPYREGNDSDLQTREKVIENITRHGKRLREWAGVPLALENFNYHPTNAYEYICEPELFTALLEATGADMLLDLAHARISANNMKWPSVYDYLQALPLHKVREVHFTRPGWEDITHQTYGSVNEGREAAPMGQMVDLHQPVQQDDLDILDWVLSHTPDPYVTLEVEELPEDVVIDQLALMRRFLVERSN
jgi:uncharacterized protein (UPF0276 family)